MKVLTGPAMNDETKKLLARMDEVLNHPTELSEGADGISHLAQQIRERFENSAFYRDNGTCVEKLEENWDDLDVAQYIEDVGQIFTRIQDENKEFRYFLFAQEFYVKRQVFEGDDYLMVAALIESVVRDYFKKSIKQKQLDFTHNEFAEIVDSILQGYFLAQWKQTLIKYKSFAGTGNSPVGIPNLAVLGQLIADLGIAHKIKEDFGLTSPEAAAVIIDLMNAEKRPSSRAATTLSKYIFKSTEVPTPSRKKAETFLRRHKITPNR